jgi:hypothetical protein
MSSSALNSLLNNDKRVLKNIEFLRRINKSRILTLFSQDLRPRTEKEVLFSKAPSSLPKLQNRVYCPATHVEFSYLRNGTKWLLDTLLPASVLFNFNCPVHHFPLAPSCDRLRTDYLLCDEDRNDVLLSVHDGRRAWKQKKCDKILVLDAVLQLNLPGLFHGQIPRKRDRCIYLGPGWQLYYPKVRAFTNTLWLQRSTRRFVTNAHHDIPPSCT